MRQINSSIKSLFIMNQLLFIIHQLLFIMNQLLFKSSKAHTYFQCKYKNRFMSKKLYNKPQFKKKHPNTSNKIKLKNMLMIIIMISQSNISIQLQFKMNNMSH